MNLLWVGIDSILFKVYMYINNRYSIKADTMGSGVGYDD